MDFNKQQAHHAFSPFSHHGMNHVSEFQQGHHTFAKTELGISTSYASSRSLTTEEFAYALGLQPQSCSFASKTDPLCWEFCIEN